jgi:urate oxidase
LLVGAKAAAKMWLHSLVPVRSTHQNRSMRMMSNVGSRWILHGPGKTSLEQRRWCNHSLANAGRVGSRPLSIQQQRPRFPSSRVLVSPPPSKNNLSRVGTNRFDATNSHAGLLIGAVAGLCGIASCIVMAYCDEEQDTATTKDIIASSSSNSPSEATANYKLRTESFPLAPDHNHGKSSVRVLIVVRNDGERHVVHEYTVNTTIFSDRTGQCFVAGDNSDIVATDTQKNIVYAVAKQYSNSVKATDHPPGHDTLSPEEFGLRVAQALLSQYEWLSAAHVQVTETIWDRYAPASQEHPHGFVLRAPERNVAFVEWHRSGGGMQKPQVTSSLVDLTVMKTTQSGFDGYYVENKDGGRKQNQLQYTILPPCSDRILSTKINATWKYNVPQTLGPWSDDEYERGVRSLLTAHPYNQIRQGVRAQLLHGFFGNPAEGGVYSPSLQSTIYDCACLVLSSQPCRESLSQISIVTPNIHYLPATPILSRMSSDITMQFRNDVFIPTSEPSGRISCTVTAKDNTGTKVKKRRTKR